MAQTWWACRNLHESLSFSHLENMWNTGEKNLKYLRLCWSDVVTCKHTSRATLQNAFTIGFNDWSSCSSCEIHSFHNCSASCPTKNKGLQAYGSTQAPLTGLERHGKNVSIVLVMKTCPRDKPWACATNTPPSALGHIAGTLGTLRIKRRFYYSWNSLLTYRMFMAHSLHVSARTP